MGEPEAPERPALRAVAAPPREIEAAPPGQPPVYADVTSPGELRPVLPYWLRGREEFRHATRRAAGREWHRARYHGLRLPWYAACTVFWGAAGTVLLAGRWLRWWLFPVPPEAHAQAKQESWRAWKALFSLHKETAKTRAVISAAVAAVTYFGGAAIWAHARWSLVPLGLAGALAAARFGRPAGMRIIQAATVPPEYEALTQDVITRALGSLGLTGINQWLRENRPIDYTGPVREDGPGWRAEMNLPYGVTATMVIERRAQLASGLRRPLGAVWPEPAPDHEGHLELWVGQQDVSKRKAAAWPLLKAGAVDVFAPVPFATDMRGRVVKAPLIYHNWLIGSMPRQGKTVTVRGLCCAVALDPYAEQWIHELKGTGDLDPLEQVCHRFVSGIDDDAIAYAAESLRLLRAEIGRRSPRVKELPPALCPDKRVTREIARRRSLRLWPVVCTIDECQNLFGHPKYGKQAGEDAEFVIKVGPAMGIVLILATQRPNKESLPTGVSGNVSLRFCLYVAGQTENDMILGTSAYKNGIRATLFRPEVDAGLGYLKGATPAPKVVRTFGHDVTAAKAVAARARAVRERAGTLTGAALGQEGEPSRDVLGDVLAAMGGDPGLHWGILADRLAARFPDRWAGATADAISAQCRALGVPSVDVKRDGRALKGCRRADVERVAVP